MPKPRSRYRRRFKPEQLEPSYPQPTAEAILGFGELHGFHFQQPQLLIQALTHRSYVNEHRRAEPDVVHYERLEFLGDAILEFLAGDWLYRRFPDLPEGQLSLLRMRLVGTESLASFTLQLGAEKYLRLGNGEEAIGARYSLRILGNLFEALLGAIYLDQGLEVARQFTLLHLEPALETLLQSVSAKDPKSRFQEWSQAQAVNITPTYHVLLSDGPDHAREFMVEVRLGDEPVGWGSGKTIRQAAHAAAESAMRWFEVDTPLTQ